MSVQNFKIKHGLNLGDHELIDPLGNINLPAGAAIQVDGAPLDALPDQTGQTGKFLSTNGSIASWDAITQYTPPTNQGAANFLAGDGAYKPVTMPTLVSELVNDAGYQTSSQVATAVANLVDAAPNTLDTLNELAAALGDNPNFATTVSNQIGAKQDALVSGTNIKTVNGNSLLGSGNIAIATYTDTDVLNYLTAHQYATFDNVNQGLASRAELSGATFTGAVSAPSFSGDGHNLTNLDWTQIGNTPSSISRRTSYIANAGDTIFAVPYTVGSVEVYLNGLHLMSGTDYTASNGTSITLTDPASAGDEIEIIGFSTFSIANVYTQAETSALIASSITSKWTQDNTKISNWDTAYSWGNHASYGYATQTYVNTQVSNLVNAAPAALDTLKELATALGNDANFSTTITTSIGTKWTQDNTKISNWDAAYSWGNHANAGYATLTYVNTNLALKADQSTTYTKTEVNNSLALKADLSTYNSFVSSTNSSISTINTGLANANFPGCSPLRAANSAVEIFDAGIRGKGFFWLNSPNGGKVLNFCDLDTLDQDGKAGWILVAMFPMAQNWRDDGLSTRMTLNPYDIMMNQNDGTPQPDRKLWSANWGDYQMNRFRIQNAWSVNEAGPNSTMDWYFHYTNACAWKQVWNFQAGTGNYINDTSGDNNGNINAAYCSGYPAPTNQAGNVPRCCLRGFKSAYNLRYGYSVDQRWNNLSDSAGGGTAQNTSYNWWAGLTQPHYTLGWGIGGDGSLAILPQGSTYTTAGQDCDVQNFKVGVDDTGGATMWASSATGTTSQTGLTDTYRSLFFWIK